MGASSGEGGLAGMVIGMVIWLLIWIDGRHLVRVGYLLIVLAMKGRRGGLDGMGL